MTCITFTALFRQFHIAKDISIGLQKYVPAAGRTGHLTCRSTAAVLQSCNPALHRCIHTRCTDLVPAVSTAVQPKRHIRKLYPPIWNELAHRRQPIKDMEIQLDYTPVLDNKGPELVEKVQAAITGKEMGRLFAVVHIDGQQRKVTAEDLLIVDGFFPPLAGDKIRLEKVLMVGGKDFTLVGRPILSRDEVKIEATVIEKTLSHIKVDFNYKKRFRRFVLKQNARSVVLINSIEVNPGALA